MSVEETQANLCEVTEKSRQSQEQLLDLTQQFKLTEAQLQTLKLEKSKLNAEYQLMKTTMDNYENDKLEYFFLLLTKTFNFEYRLNVYK